MTEPRYEVRKISEHADWCFITDTVIGAALSDAYSEDACGSPDWYEQALNKCEEFNEIESWREPKAVELLREWVAAEHEVQNVLAGDYAEYTTVEVNKLYERAKQAYQAAVKFVEGPQ